MRAALSLALMAVVGAVGAAANPPSTMNDILSASPPADWRLIDPAQTLYLDLAPGKIIIELAPRFAPHHVANIKALAKGGYFDGLAVVRVQDNYVVQWADPDGKRSVGGAQRTLKAEFESPYGADTPFTSLPDPDTYAPQTGFTDGFPAARDPATGLTWLTHCYGMVGAGRDNDADSGGGTELYAVIGQAPRQLDRNVTLVGRVVRGVDSLSSLPRGHGDLGFYQTPKERIPIVSIRLGSDLPRDQQVPLQALRTDSATFASLLQSRRFRQDAWYKTPTGKIDVCNMPLPVRTAR
jgi:peptidylprolyl isomerase